MDFGENKCSFCGKKQSQVRLIAGPRVFICSECVALCNEILAHDPEVAGQPSLPAGPDDRGPVLKAEISPAQDRI